MSQAYVNQVQGIKEEEMKTEFRIEQMEVNEIQNLLNTFLENGSQLDQSIFQDNNGLNNKSKLKSNSKYSSMKVKARNLLTNAAYTRHNKDDLKKPSFTIDIASFILQYLNLTGLDRKL